jgi:nucleoside-diphosphate-sugar epimerase
MGFLIDSASSTIPPGGLVLVTGANGFIGSYIVKGLLRHGYAVRGTVRSEDKAAWIKEAMAESNPSAAFETVLVPDSTAPGAWKQAVKGVDGVVHVAADMSFSCDPNIAITPMINSVRSLLETAAEEPSIKRFVMTSSNRAVFPQLVGEAVTVDSTMWNEESIQKAWAPPPYEADRTWDVYSALKTQTEQEIWKFSRDMKPGFVVNSVLPCFTIGPILHPKQPGSTAKLVMDFWKDPGCFAPLQGFGASFYIDSEDTADLHIAALTQEDVKNERLMGFAGPFNFNSWVEVFRQLDPLRPWPADDPAQGHDLSKIDCTRELELLKRLGKTGWTSFYDSVKRTCLESR